MIAEWLIHRAGWGFAWCANPGPYAARQWLRTEPPWHVGELIGPAKNLVCVRWCETNEDARACTSPAGWTVLDATLRALWKERSLERDGTRSTLHRNSLGSSDRGSLAS